MKDILDIKRMLDGRVLDVAQKLLPNGRKEGHEWRAGSVNGEKGQSLGVHLDGAKAGVWADFSSGERGDLIDLWALTRRIDLADALKEIRDYLGIRDERKPYHEPRRDYKRPPKPKCRAPEGAVMAYLREVRCIPKEIIVQYQIGEDGTRIVFPFKLPDGTLALAKVREAVDGAKPMPTAKDCEPILFGWHAIPASSREVVLTEGEIDALAMAAYGWPAMSVPFGGGGKGKQQWIENDFDRLDRFERIYLATDMDEQGDAAAVEIASRLGRHRCYRVFLPHKDADECRMEGVEKDEIARCIETAASMDPEGLKLIGEFYDRVMAMFYPAADAHVGYGVPYPGLRSKLLFRPAEVTLWTGASGDGKSQVISDCIPEWVRQGSRVAVASFEMKCEQTAKRLFKQAGGVDRPTPEFGRKIMEFLHPNVLLYERVGKCSAAGVLEVFDYARAKYGCDQFVIDSLMRLGIAPDDYAEQEKVVFSLVDWAVSNNVHLHLVAHSRKGNSQRSGVPETEDVKGTSEIGANAFNIVAVWRNRKLEASGEGERPRFTDDPGVTLNVAKQRNGDFEGKVKLFFDTWTYQYRAPSENRQFARCYADNPNQQGETAYE